MESRLRNGVHDFLGEGVEAAVVDAEAESAIMLFREKYAGSKRGVGWLDPAVARVLVQLGLEGAVLLGVHPVDPPPEVFQRPASFEQYKHLFR